VTHCYRLAKDGHDSALIYTKARDIHYAGVVFLQMILGRDVVERFPDAQAALVCCESSPWFMSASHTLQPRYPLHFNESRQAWSRKRRNTHHVLRFLENWLKSHSQSRAPLRYQVQVCHEIYLLDIVLINKHQDPKTPVPQSYGSSPEVDYFRAPIQRRQQTSRWKEDWEELELLVGVVYRWTWS
jgi:eukaryotic translation initiation factor 2-alpha kinase 4